MLTLKKKLLSKNDSPPGSRVEPVSVESCSVEYCVPGNHADRALGLASALRRQFDLAVELVPSRGGVFEVRVGGRLVFSKRATRRFPDDDEIFYHVRQAVV